MNYLENPKQRAGRHHSGPFFDLPYDEEMEYQQHSDCCEDKSFKARWETPRLNLRTIRQYLRERNPHGD